MAESDSDTGDATEAPVNKLNLNLLYPLDAILQAQTLTEAGRRVRLTQPAMSHALRRLRDHFGDDLVVHTGRGQQLTELGLALRGEVRRVLREVDGALNFALTFDPQTSTDTITIAASEAIEQMVMGPVLRNLSHCAPGLRVDLVALDAKEPQRALDQGADVLLVPEDAAIPGFESAFIMQDRASCMVWNQHPVLADQVEISEAQFLSGRHIVAQGEMTASFAADATGLEMLKARAIHVRATSQATLPTIVLNSDLIATGSTWLFQQYASVMPLKVLAPPFARRKIPIIAQWPRHRHIPMVYWLVEQLRTLHR